MRHFLERSTPGLSAQAQLVPSSIRSASLRWRNGLPLFPSEQDLMRWCRRCGANTSFLGGGSNLLLTHDIEAPVLQLCPAWQARHLRRRQHGAGGGDGGERWHAFVQWTLAQGRRPRNLSLIPGFFGARAGAEHRHGVEMAATCDSV